MVARFGYLVGVAGSLFLAASQLEKIDMLDFADLVAINKFDCRGGKDALHDLSKQLQRNRGAFDHLPDKMPVFGAIASSSSDDGVTALYQRLVTEPRLHGLAIYESKLPPVFGRASTSEAAILPPQRQHYLAELAETVRDYHKTVAHQSQIARERQQLRATKHLIEAEGELTGHLARLTAERTGRLDPRVLKLLQKWPKIKQRYGGDKHRVVIGSKERRIPLFSVSDTLIPELALPDYQDHGELLRWLLLESLPRSFPYTAGAFPFKHQDEEPTRMFAGDGDAFRTNRRFKQLCQHSGVKRLSTAFDSVTLYGWDPDTRPDITGRRAIPGFRAPLWMI